MGGAVFPPLLFTWSKLCGVNEDNGDLLQKVPCMHCCTQCSQPSSRPPLIHVFAADFWTLLGKSGSVFCGVTTPFSWVLAHTISVCALQVLVSQSSVSSGGSMEVNGDLLLEDLCHTQVCCTQSPCPCGSPLLTHTSTGDTQTRFCLSVCGALGPGCAQGLFEPSEHLWCVWGLILNLILSLLPSCWGFCCALGHGLSLHSHSSTMQLPLQIT